MLTCYIEADGKGTAFEIYQHGELIVAGSQNYFGHQNDTQLYLLSVLRAIFFLQSRVNGNSAELYISNKLVFDILTGQEKCNDTHLVDSIHSIMRDYYFLVYSPEPNGVTVRRAAESVSEPIMWNSYRDFIKVNKRGAAWTFSVLSKRRLAEDREAQQRKWTR